MPKFTNMACNVEQQKAATAGAQSVQQRPSTSILHCHANVYKYGMQDIRNNCQQQEQQEA
jgi:hypothetical protein